MSNALQPHGDVRHVVREDPRPDLPRGPVVVRSEPSVPHVVLRRALRGVPVHQDMWPRSDAPTLMILCLDDNRDATSAVSASVAEACGAPVVVFGPSADLQMARTALRSGATGFLHAHMPPDHISRALYLAEDREVVLPKDLLGAVVNEARGPDLSMLTTRQVEILDLVAIGLTNAQVAERLYVSESTVKQHLRAAYKIMGVRNRVAASALFRRCRPALRSL